MSEERAVDNSDALDDGFDPGTEDEHEIERQEPSGAEGSSGADRDSASGDDTGAPSGIDDAPRDGDEVSLEDVEQRGRQAQVRRGPRASDRFQTLANRNRDLERQLAELQRQQGDFARQQQEAQQRQQAELERQQEEQFLLTASPQDMARYYADKSRREMQREMQVTRYQIYDSNDQAEFEREMVATPRLRTVYERNRERFDELRRQAPGVRRIDLLDKLVGEMARQNMGAARTRQERRAADALNGRQTRPAATRGNVAGERTRSGARRNDFSHMRDVLI